MAKNKNRQQKYKFSSQSLYTVHSVFAQRVDSSFQYHSFADLAKKQIIAIRGTKTAKRLMKEPSLNINLTHSPTASLQMLLAHRGDMVFYHDLGLTYIIKKNNWQNKIQMKQHIEKYEHFIAYNKTVHSPIRDLIDTKIKAMKQDGTIDKILK